jgi:hypothetical protein
VAVDPIAAANALLNAVKNADSEVKSREQRIGRPLK